MKKGFTLIELLAVIIILAIVALVATPIVLDVVEDARKSAAKSQTALVLDSAKLYYAEQYFKTENSFDGYECSISNKVGCSELSLEGEKPDSAVLSIDKSGRVNGKVVVGKYTYYICNNKVTDEETDGCSFVDYSYIYEITSEGIITGFKKVANTVYLNIIPVVKAEELTQEVIEYLEDKEITIPEYVGDIEVKGIADNAFASYDIDVITILSNNALTIGTNSFPVNLIKLRVSSCLEDSYSTYSDKLELIERQCPVEELATYKDNSGANRPELLNNMIPVIYDEDNSTWVYADVYEKWYDYDEQMWANAVVLESEITKSVGEPISEDEIALMYVWIPRYTYTIFNANKESISPTLINIKFESGTDSTGTVTCDDAINQKNSGGYDISETCTDKNGDGSIVNGESTYTHPAFTFGEEKLTGFWIGKFEVSGSTSKITIKPNVKSLKNWYSVSNFFGYIKNIASIYNLNGDSHMIKNMEWGAVAYLKQSIYGLGIADIGRNPSSDNITGCGGEPSGVVMTTCNSYNTTEGKLASTTGNIYGVYDMSGGTHEVVMGNMMDSDGSFKKETAGFTEEIEPKYYDAYSYTTYGRNPWGKFGDATSETIGWYGDEKDFPNSSNMWFKRSGYYTGGNYSSKDAAGIFSIFKSGGGKDGTTRAVLTP